MTELDTMTREELADRWEERDLRYAQMARRLTDPEVEAVILWRTDEAETIGSKEMAGAAQDWKRPHD